MVGDWIDVSVNRSSSNQTLPLPSIQTHSPAPKSPRKKSDTHEEENAQPHPNPNPPSPDLHDPSPGIPPNKTTRTAPPSASLERRARGCRGFRDGAVTLDAVYLLNKEGEGEQTGMQALLMAWVGMGWRVDSSCAPYRVFTHQPNIVVSASIAAEGLAWAEKGRGEWHRRRMEWWAGRGGW